MNKEEFTKQTQKQQIEQRLTELIKQGMRIGQAITTISKEFNLTLSKEAQEEIARNKQRMLERHKREMENDQTKSQ